MRYVVSFVGLFCAVAGLPQAAFSMKANITDATQPIFVLQDQSNDISEWLMGGPGGQVVERSPVIGTSAANWRVMALADFNSDGVPDILLENTATFQLSVWYMGGPTSTTVTSSPVVAQAASGWMVVGAGDFNNDGFTDIILQNATSNALSIWYLGPNFTLQSAPVVATPLPGWKVLGVADFNKDGSPDLLLQNQSTNQVSIWYLSTSGGSFRLLSAPIIATASPNWEVVGTTDVDGDGAPDIVLQNSSTNQLSVWYMGGAQGSTIITSPVIGTANPGWTIHAVGHGPLEAANGPTLFLQNQVDNGVSFWVMGGAFGTIVELAPTVGTAAPNWRLQSGGDFNKDGFMDILFENTTTNQISVWYMGGMNGSTVTSSPIVAQAAAGWMVVGVADFDNNGTLDFLLQNATSNALSIWYLNPNFQIITAPVIATPLAGWKVVGVADFNQDGTPDFLLQNHNTNQVSIWYMTNQGKTILSAPVIGNTPPAWNVVGAADFNGDGTPDIVVQNPTTGEVDVWYMGSQGTTITSTMEVAIAQPNWLINAVQ